MNPTLDPLLQAVIQSSARCATSPLNTQEDHAFQIGYLFACANVIYGMTGAELFPQMLDDFEQRRSDKEFNAVVKKMIAHLREKYQSKENEEYSTQA